MSCTAEHCWLADRQFVCRQPIEHLACIAAHESIIWNYIAKKLWVGSRVMSHRPGWRMCCSALNCMKCTCTHTFTAISVSLVYHVCIPLACECWLLPAAAPTHDTTVWQVQHSCVSNLIITRRRVCSTIQIETDKSLAKGWRPHVTFFFFFN